VLYQQDIKNCFADEIGPTGLDRVAFDTMLESTGPALDRLRTARDDGTIPLLNLPENTADLEEMEEVAARYLESFDDVAVLGIGGSSLGGKALAALTEMPVGRAPLDGPRVHFFDNIDPHNFDQGLRHLDPVRTGFLVISKSGGSAETLSQFLHCVSAVQDILTADQISERFTIITDPGENPLRRLATRFALPVLDHIAGIGGRFAALSNVGLLPALISGVDAAAVRAGAAEVIASALNADKPGDCPAAVGAALSVSLDRVQGVNTTVLMPYIERLAEFGLWYRQLWAESLGKDGHGMTPVRSMGAVDQHSQLQLYLDGPRDKMFTLLFNAAAGTGGEIPADLITDSELAYLGGHRIGDLMDAEQRATAETLARHGCPTRVIRIGQLDESTMGALMMHFMLETIIAADLMGINAFDQPAVDEGKILTRAYLIGDPPR
jgi:glucose-6-phosphate isomerase